MDGEGLTVDDSNIAWKTDVDKMFAAVLATFFNTLPQLRGGGTINGTLKVMASTTLPCNATIA
jgi:hypothetical protein